jgi:catechol 2,3-dioxygenase-like lactoylglutathione lyase family enzyme
VPLDQLSHYAIQAHDLDVTRDFYVEVLGLSVGDRPPLDFPGYWLYSGDAAVVHLLGRRAPRDGVREAAPGVGTETGRLDHIAFAASGLSEIRARFRDHQVAFREQVLPRLNATQLFVEDPDGVGVELNFPPGETGT